MGGGSRRKTVNAVTSGGSCSESSNSLAERTIRCSSAGRPKGFCKASFTMATLEFGATWILMIFPAIVETSKSLNSSVLGILEPGSSLRDREGMRASGIKYTSKEAVVAESISTALTWSKFILSHKFNQFLTNDLLWHWHVPRKHTGSVTLRIHGNEGETNAEATNLSQKEMIMASSIPKLRVQNRTPRLTKGSTTTTLPFFGAVFSTSPSRHVPSARPHRWRCHVRWRESRAIQNRRHRLYHQPGVTCWVLFPHEINWQPQKMTPGGWPTPLKNDGVRQLGWWHSQLNGKIKFMFQTTNQTQYLYHTKGLPGNLGLKPPPTTRRKHFESVGFPGKKLSCIHAPHSQVDQTHWLCDFLGGWITVPVDLSVVWIRMVYTLSYGYDK